LRVLVTGADGFVGRHLCRHLKSQGDEVVEAVGPGKGALAFLGVDVTHGDQVRAAVARANPDGIIHLAGFSSVAKSHADPGQAFAVNTLGTVHLLTAVREVAKTARVLLIGSGEMYGAVPAGQRATEEFPLRPSSPYAASKLAAEVAGLQFHRGAGLHVVNARSFNHLGPGQDRSFVVPSFASQLAEMAKKGKAGQDAVLRTGDLTPVRDFSHVEDVVAAYRLLLTRGDAGGVYNVCSGEGRTIASLLDELMAIAGVKPRVETDPARVRPVEIPSLVGDPGRLLALGFKPTRSVGDALREVFASVKA
jgi:GDP-4-dehydro-6-deoxy-D-mannose reductase